MEFRGRQRRITLLPGALPEGAAPDAEIPMDIRVSSWRKRDPRRLRRGQQRTLYKKRKQTRA